MPPVAVVFDASRVTTRSHVTGRSVVRIFIVPSSFAFHVPVAGRGRGRPLRCDGVNSAYRYVLVASVLNLIHSSRRSLSLFSRSRSARIFEPGANEPSASTATSPSMTVVVTTASPGSATPATCSFTRMTAFEPSATWNADAPAGITRPVAVALAATAAADGVVVVDGAGATAAPPQVSTSRDTAQLTAMLRIRTTYRRHPRYVHTRWRVPPPRRACPWSVPSVY